MRRFAIFIGALFLSLGAKNSNYENLSNDLVPFKKNFAKHNISVESIELRPPRLEGLYELSLAEVYITFDGKFAPDYISNIVLQWRNDYPRSARLIARDIETSLVEHSKLIDPSRAKIIARNIRLLDHSDASSIAKIVRYYPSSATGASSQEAIIRIEQAGKVAQQILAINGLPFELKNSTESELIFSNEKLELDFFVRVKTFDVRRIDLVEEILQSIEADILAHPQKYWKILPELTRARLRQLDKSKPLCPAGFST